MEHGERLLRKLFGEQRLQVAGERCYAFRRETRADSGAGANAPAPRLVRVGHDEIEREGLEAAESRRGFSEIPR
jgi:hypothetical protein